jgi:hypothetical protein
VVGNMVVVDSYHSIVELFAWIVLVPWVVLFAWILVFFGDEAFPNEPSNVKCKIHS